MLLPIYGEVVKLLLPIYGEVARRAGGAVPKTSLANQPDLVSQNHRLHVDPRLERARPGASGPMAVGAAAYWGGAVSVPSLWSIHQAVTLPFWHTKCTWVPSAKGPMVCSLT